MATLPGQKMNNYALVKIDGEGIGTITLRSDIAEELAHTQPRLVLSYELALATGGYHIRSFAIVPEPAVEETAVESEKGVWVTYTNNPGPVAGQVFEKEIDALRSALKNVENVVFVPFGKTIREAIDGEG